MLHVITGPAKQLSLEKPAKWRLKTSPAMAWPAGVGATALHCSTPVVVVSYPDRFFSFLIEKSGLGTRLPL